LEAALAIRRELGHRPGEAAALQLLGELDLAAGEPAAARDRFAAALDLQRAIGLPLGEARSLAGLAAAERRLGRLEPARGRFEEAVGVIESLRAAVAAPDQRAAFLSTQRRTFEQYLDLLLELHRREPAGSWAAAALELHERSRARGLLDLLQESGAELRRGVDPELDRREQEVLQRLNAKAQRRAEAPAGATGEARRRALEGEAAALLAELDRLETEIRRQSPRYAAVTPQTPLRAAEVQALIDPGTLLLEYSLGEERSALWAVSDGALELHELPGRTAIETAVGRGLAALRTVAVGEAADDGNDLAILGRMLLGPVAGRLAGRRLVVVPDGVLEMLPFAALPEPSAEPGQKEDPLVVRHEIAYLPSASVLAALRREPAPPPAERTLAVLADPVFDRRDPRVAAAAAVIAEGAVDTPPPSLPASPTVDVTRAGFARLPGSRREAEAIAALVEPRQARVLLDFQASRRALLDGALAGSRILHLATHGVIDTRTPELSGLVLSLVDERGAPQDGFLGLRDVFGLRLDAELVVLSGCETALGKELRGEGLMGLTRGFLYAGARRVAASLWRVQDRATAELMTRFYQGLLTHGLPPAAALREAQLALLGDRRFAAPAYWAPFIVVGDWRPDR
jgi:CHAT domain-containing protein/tetratricopeptide (TPR) repeat protein